MCLATPHLVKMFSLNSGDRALRSCLAPIYIKNTASQKNTRELYDVTKCHALGYLPLCFKVVFLCRIRVLAM